ncbi:MAG TPA: PadR family transcriptional regulator [Mycobacterium sp.]|nr:PadR family transcriptional regulator [Mycobacterium sp.]
MTTPFSPFGGSAAGGSPGYGFGFGPQSRRDFHDAKRHAKWELHDQLRHHGAGHCGPPGFGPGFGPGFAPGFAPGFGPGGPGFGFGPPRGGRRGRGPGHRANRSRRGDVRAAILVLLAERPMHGYEMIQQIAERSQDLWRPSPGSVYPTLQLLVDEGLIVGNETGSSKRLFELTEEGRAAAEAIENPPWQEIADCVDPGQVSLRAAIGQLFGAVGQAAFTASSDQQQRIVDIVNNARREVYTILGETE